MTPVEISLVQDSFRKIARIAPQAAALFFARLFELDPTLRTRFSGDMHEQGSKLMATMAAAVGSLDHFEALVPAIRSAGMSPVGFGLGSEHSTTAGTALLWTLEKGLGGDFTPAVHDAWAHTYSLLADTLIESRRDVPAA